MNNEENEAEILIGEMRRRRETMPDGKRYIIFYTFSDEEESKIEVEENV